MISFLLAFQNGLKNLFALIATLARILFMSKKRVKLPPAPLPDCLVLGNGPSLTASLTARPRLVSEASIFCVNAFALSNLYTDIKPQYYVLAAPEYWQSGVLAIYVNARNRLFEAIVQKTTWPLVIFASAEAQKYPEFAQTLSKNQHVSIYYFNTTPVEGFTGTCHFFYRMGWGIPRPHNILIPALMLAVGMGHKRVYLLGADHSWLPEISVNNQNEVLVHQKHFYDETHSKPDRMYYAGRRPRRLYEVLEKFYFTFRSYFYIDRYARSRGTIIYNATPYSFIDAFERKDIF